MCVFLFWAYTEDVCTLYCSHRSQWPLFHLMCSVATCNWLRFLVLVVSSGNPSCMLSDLSLDIPAKYIKTSGSDEPPECTLTDCLNSFTAVERLAESELFSCVHCQQKQPSTKKFYVTKSPKVWRKFVQIVVYYVRALTNTCVVVWWRVAFVFRYYVCIWNVSGGTPVTVPRSAPTSTSRYEALMSAST